MRARFVVLTAAAALASGSGCGPGAREHTVAEVGVVDGEELWSYEASPANRLGWTDAATVRDANM